MSRSRDNHTGSTRIMWERNGHGILETAFESNTISAKMAFFHSISVFDSHFLSFICLFDRLLKIILTKILEFNRLLLSSFFFFYLFFEVEFAVIQGGFLSNRRATLHTAGLTFY